MENIGIKEQVGVVIDWQVKVTRTSEIIEAKPMSVEPARIRLYPVYLETGEMTMVVPAVSEEAAEEKAKNISRHVVSVGLWGEEIWDFTNFLASIEKFL